jgi:hypothetical protein
MEQHSALIPSPHRDTQLHRELRSKIMIQYVILRDHENYVYNPSSLSDYLCSDPGVLLSIT